MSVTSWRSGALALYKGRPALVKHVTKKLTIQLDGGEQLSVRPKDLELLHPGPLASLADLRPQAGEVQAAWELLAGSQTTLAELADLAFNEFSPATAWAAWQLVADGLRFHGNPESISVRSAEEVAAIAAARAAKLTEARARKDFLARLQAGQVQPDDAPLLRDVEDLALGRSDKSRVLRELGRAQSQENAHALLLKLGIWDHTNNPHPTRLEVITTSAQADLPSLPDEDRLDLTHLSAVAIDDAGNTDPDDALSYDSGRLWVHIADVAALVPPGSPADLAARERGASLYLPEGTITMLPAAATAQLGLGLQEISPALSFGLDLDDDGDIVGIEIAPSWVRVSRLSYDEAEKQLDSPALAPLHHLAQLRQARRRENQAVFIDLPEVKIHVRDDGQVEIRSLLPLRSRDLVTEAMLAAGEAAARFALERDIPLPFTSQEPPESRDEALPDGLAGMFALRRTLKPSQQSSLPLPHSGLGLDIYTRATSPLRRYLDLVVHQQLRAYLCDEPLMPLQTVLERVGAAEAAGGGLRQAERLSRQHWTLVYLQQNPGWQGEGILVDRYGLRGTVIIPDLAWETRLSLRDPLPLNARIPLSFQGMNLPQLDAHFQIFQIG